MQSSFVSDYGLWLEAVVVLGLGTAGIAALAGVTTRLVRTTSWQQKTWRIATLAIGILLLVELTGVGTGLAWLVRPMRSPTPDTSTVDSQDTCDSSSARPLPSTLANRSANLDHHTLGQTAASRPTDQRQHGERDELSLIDALHGSVMPDRPVVIERAFRELSGSVRHGPTIAAFANPDRPSSPPATDESFLVRGMGRVSSSDSRGVLRGGAERTASVPPLAHSRPYVIGTFEHRGPGLRVADTGSHRRVPPVRTGAARTPVARWPGIIWLLGVALLAIHTIWSRLVLSVYFARLSRSIHDEAMDARIASLGIQLGFRCRVRLVESTGLAAPVAFGLLRPTIALPTTFADDFEPRQQHVILAHELAHLAARDPAWQLFTDLVTACLWWHPWMWWTRRCLRATSEAAADEASLLVPHGPDALAQCLVTLGRRLTRMPRGRMGWLSVQGTGFRSGLGRRVERLLNLPNRPWRAPARAPAWIAMTLLPVILVAAALFSTAWGRPQVRLTHGETTMHVLHNSWRRSLAAATLVPLFGVFSGQGTAQEPGKEAERTIVRDDDAPTAERAETERRRNRERPEMRERLEQRRREADERRETRAPRRERRAEGGRERPVARQSELIQERRELEERAHDIQRELDKLRPEQDDEARDLQSALREIRERMERIEREALRPERERREADRRHPQERERELMHERRELEERARDIQRELDRLRPEQDDQTRELQGAMREVRVQMERIEREAHGPRRERPDAGPYRPLPPSQRDVRHERDMLHEQLAELEAAFRQAREAGKQEEAEHLQRSMAEVAERLAHAENAGDVPPQIREQFESMEGVVRELRGQVEEMRREMAEMRRLLKAIAERERD